MRHLRARSGRAVGQLISLASEPARRFVVALGGTAGAGIRRKEASRAWQSSLMSHLTAETVGHVRILRLDRPERKNALTSSRRTKRLVARAPLITDVDARVTDEIRNALAGLDSEDGQEAVQAIIEKRTPEFRGR